MTVLYYINNESTKFRTYVANRIAVIHALWLPSEWKYVETSVNPADDASRGLPVDKFLKSERWISGPEFLKDNENEWPSQPELSGISLSEDFEVKKEVVMLLQLQLSLEDSSILKWKK